MRQRFVKSIVQELVVSAVRIFQQLQLRQRDRALRQRFIDEIIELRVLGEFGGRPDAVSRVTCTGAYAQHASGMRVIRLAQWCSHIICSFSDQPMVESRDAMYTFLS